MHIAALIITIAGITTWFFSDQFPDPQFATRAGFFAAILGAVFFILLYPADPEIKKRKPKTCPICGLRSIAIRKRKGSLLLAIFLLLFWILPGVLYLIFRGGHVMACSKCGAKIADAA